MHNCHSTPIHCPSGPPSINLSPVAHHAEATKPQPSPHCWPISFFYDGCYPLHHPELLCSYAVIKKLPLDPDADVKPPRTTTTLGLVFINARTGNDSLQHLPWLGLAGRAARCFFDRWV